MSSPEILFKKRGFRRNIATYKIVATSSKEIRNSYKKAIKRAKSCLGGERV